MQTDLEEIIALQAQYSSRNTPAMQRRGELIRRVLPAELAVATARIARALGPYGRDLNFEGRDGTGMKTYVPWVRLFSRVLSPSAQNGWYCVYLFEATGRGVYLALAHGSTDFQDGEFKPKPAEQLAELVAWGRQSLGAELAENPTLIPHVQLGGKVLGDAYERSTVVARWYPADGVPSDEQLYDDVVRFAGLLRAIYDAETTGRTPNSRAPEATEVELAASGRSAATGQGFGLTASERRAVELHAMSRAKAHLRGLGWSVQDVSGSRPYDLYCTQPGATLVVEVKGTTTAGRQVVLTRNEVQIQRRHFPANALVVVHSIELRREGNPEAEGGDLVMLSPWSINDEQLQPLAYFCQLTT
jgi:hypothetical protein